MLTVLTFELLERRRLKSDRLAYYTTLKYLITISIEYIGDILTTKSLYVWYKCVYITPIWWQQVIILDISKVTCNIELYSFTYPYCIIKHLYCIQYFNIMHSVHTSIEFWKRLRLLVLLGFLNFSVNVSTLLLYCTVAPLSILRDQEDTYMVVSKLNVLMSHGCNMLWVTAVIVFSLHVTVVQSHFQGYYCYFRIRSLWVNCVQFIYKHLMLMIFGSDGAIN